MNFQEAEKAYQDLRAQYSAGKLSNTDFEAEVSKLKVQDADGRWWQIGVQSGDWYVHDGQKWSKSRPPAPGTMAAQPAAPPEGTGPSIGTGAAAGPSGGIPTGGARVRPRLFSAAPAGRGGGMPTPALIGIIAVVALVGIAILVAAFLLVSGQLRGTPTTVALATRTATTAAVVAPSPALPTLPPPATNTAIPLPTVALTPTVAVTATKPISAPVTGTVAARTPTRRPGASPTAAAPTKAAAAATATPSLKPGVYVSKIRTDPVKPSATDAINFYVTFFNNSTALGPTPWIVKLYKCDNACTGDELARSIGETPKSFANIIGGTTEVKVGPYTPGLGPCTLVASPYFTDPVTGQLLPFPTTGGQDRLYYIMKLCQ
ncbi:MAG TPA: hypothetical protein VF932_05445 [Anaerolineae bacterium]